MKDSPNSCRTSFITELISNSPQETADIGRQIASRLSAGSVVALQGTLGSGKTHLTKGIALGLGILETITSPTYTIINEYPLADTSHLKASSFYHIDVYRLNDEKEFEDTGGLEIINGNGICVIEWSERILNFLPADAIGVSLEITGISSRKFHIKGLECHK